MEPDSKFNVYKEIIFEQQKLLNELLELNEGEGKPTQSTVKNQVRDLQLKIEALFYKEQKTHKLRPSLYAQEPRPDSGEGDICTYENSNQRSSSLPLAQQTSYSPRNSVRFGDMKTQNIIHEDKHTSSQQAFPLEILQQTANPFSNHEQVSDSTNSGANEDREDVFDDGGNRSGAENPYHLQIPFVPERVSSAAAIIPEIGNKHIDNMMVDVRKRGGSTDPIPIRESPVTSPSIPPVIFRARFDSISDSKVATKTDSVQSLKLITTNTLQTTPFKIQIKRGTPPSTQILSFIFKFSTDNQVIGFIEKGRNEFVAIEQAIRSAFNADVVQSLGPFPEKSEFSGTANGRQIGAILQNWLSNAIANCVDFPPLLDFFNSNVVPPPIMKESFRRQGNLIKKGNYFGGWKTRHYNLDAGSGMVFYSDANQSEILGCFSLQYAYTISMQSQPNGQNDLLENPGFIVTEYKKAHFSPNAVIQEGTNQDGLPLGKSDVRHIFYADSVAERDSWVRCLSGVIAKLRANDIVAQELFAKTAVPEKRDDNWPSIESLSNSNRPSLADPVSNYLSNTTTKPEVLKSGGQESMDKVKKVSLPNAAHDWTTNIRNRNIRKATATTTSALLQQSTDIASDPSVPVAVTPPIATTSPISSTAPNELIFNNPVIQKSLPNTVTAHASQIPSRPKAAYVDAQTSCMLQDLPVTLEELLNISPAKQSVDGRKKLGKGKFTEWVKQAAKNSADILKDRRDINKANLPPKLQLFGVTIQEAVLACPIKSGIDIPAIVYRCIEYLDAKKAASEEGLYRLSGASSVITALRQKFEEEGNFTLIDEYYDPHAIAGLLKLFFRELSEPLFTFQLRMNFFRIAELPDRENKITGTIELLRKLPSANYACLRSLLAHLLSVVKKSDINKMTVRNVSIVFSPTLGVPAGLFTLMLAEFSTIFRWGPMDPTRTDLTHDDPVSAASPALDSDHLKSGSPLNPKESPANGKWLGEVSQEASIDLKKMSHEGIEILDHYSIAESENVPARTTSQPAKSHQIVGSHFDNLETSEDGDRLQHQPSSLVKRFLLVNIPDEDLGMM